MNAVLPVEQQLTVLVHIVNLEYLFCQICADCRSLHDGLFSYQREPIFTTLAELFPKSAKKL